MAERRVSGCSKPPHNVPAVYGVDTRAVTKLIRESGAVLGKLVFDGQDTPLVNPNVENLVAQVRSGAGATGGGMGDEAVHGPTDVVLCPGVHLGDQGVR